MNTSDSLWPLWLLTGVVWTALLAALYLGSLFFVV